MKVIFLDIDGVLNSVRSAVAYDGYPYSNRNYDKFDDVAVTLIRNVCLQYEVKIVLSSTWRKFKGWDNLKNVLNLPIIDRTGEHLSSIRGEEIAEWLRNHPEVIRYAIIDDDSDMLEEQKQFHIHTSGEDGFSYGNYEQLIKLLREGLNNGDG